MILTPQQAAPFAQPTKSPVSPSDGLLLRVENGVNAGAHVRLRRRTCTIGSAPASTLRLASDTFQPVHCLIVRGPIGTVIRSCSPEETRLNGTEFKEEWLNPGDRLSIRDLDLRVVDDRYESIETSLSGVDAAPDTETGDTASRRGLRRHYRQRVGRLCGLLRETRQGTSETATDHDVEPKQLDLQGRLDEFQAELERWQSNADEQQQDWADHCSRVAEFLKSTQQVIDEHQLSEWYAESVPLHAEQSLDELEAQLQSRQLELDEKFRQLVDERQHLDEQHLEIEQTQARADDELQTLRRELEAEFESRRHRFDSDRATAEQLLESDRQQLDEERSLLLEEREQWKAQQEQSDRGAAEFQLELETERQAWDVERRDLTEQLDRVRLEYEELRDAEASMRTELEAHATDRDRQVKQLELRISELEADLSRDVSPTDAETEHEIAVLRGKFEQLEAERNDLALQLEQSETQRQTTEAEEGNWQAEHAELMGQLQEARDIIGECRDAVEERDRLQLQLADALSRCDDLECQLADGPDSSRVIESDAVYEDDESAVESAESEDLAADEPHDGADDPETEPLEFEACDDETSPVDTASILARFAPDLLNEIGEDDKASVATESVVPSEDAPDANITQRSAEPENDNSLENYMADLMERVGNKGYLPVAPSSEAEDGEVATEAKADDSLTSDAEPTTGSSESPFLPRSQIPWIDLSAMRDVANESARRDISRHEGRLNVQEAYLKWCLALAAFIIAFSLLHWSERFASLKILEAAAAMVAGIFWTFHGFIHFRGKRGRINVAGVRKFDEKK